jgi:WD40 repeat protein
MRVKGLAPRNGTVMTGSFVHKIWSAVGVLILLLRAPLMAPAQMTEPPKNPILRVNAGMHTDVVQRIATDADNRYLVTGSNDKTVKVWELATGRLIKTLRPPIGDGSEGEIQAIAISPDGRTVACGGITGFEWDHSVSIYFFSVDSGVLIKRISGLPDAAFHLAYSRDGALLFAGLGGQGIRVFDTRNYEPVFADTDYQDSVYSGDFDNAGKLVTASLDGYIRLYHEKGRVFTLTHKTKTPAGGRPFAIRFAPDGSKVAVGFSESPKVEIFSGRDLSYQYAADTANSDASDFCGVAWSPDGQELYAAGRSSSSDILKWTDFGRGKRKTINGSESTIDQLVPLKNGGVAFAAADPAFGVINSSDQRILFVRSAQVDFSAARASLMLSNNGEEVQVKYGFQGETRVRINTRERSVKLIQPSNTMSGKPALSGPVTGAEGLQITDWENAYDPKLNGSPLKLLPHEVSQAFAIAPNHKVFLLGTEWYLRLFDKSGRQRWAVASHGVAWAVNISGDGRIAVAAFGDGTIRWYRLSDGKELLAFFPHNDKQRWVFWTPSGYYDASPGAEDLIGWHINNGKDNAADFFPISRFRSQYYRPDIVASVLETLNEEQAVTLANNNAGRNTRTIPVATALPPLVSILSPADGTTVRKTEMTIRYSARSRMGEPITRVEARVNGNPVKVENLESTAGEVTRSMTIPLPTRDSTVAVIARNRNGASEPAFIRFKWVGGAEEQGIDVRPVLRVLAIGVSNYTDKSLRDGVQYAAKDAADFVKAVSSQKGTLYKDVQSMVLTDEKAATKEDILSGLAWIQEQTTANDVAMIFMSGHGVNDSNLRYFFLPERANITTNGTLFVTAVRDADIIDTVKFMQGIVLLFVDTCHSGNIMAATKGGAPDDINGLINQLINVEKQGVIFTSSTGSQSSRQVPGNGAFTKAVVEGFSGKAAVQGSSSITVTSLGVYVEQRVRDLTNGMQTPPRPMPLSKEPGSGTDFPIAVELK